MLKDQIVEDSASPWNFPLLIVPKKSSTHEKKWRVVIDYRKLNEITTDDIFPLPNISDILDKLGSAQYFSSLDLYSGYHQVNLQESDRIKTAFSTDDGHYHFVRMPFGLKGAPSTFQRMINNVLSGLNNIKCLVYLDDIVIFGTTLLEHNKRLVEVFERFRKSNLKLNASKCQFLRQEITYLGHIVTSSGIRPDENKISVVENFPVPKNSTEIKSFLGFVGYYRRFIPNFSAIAKPVTSLLKKNQKFEWNALCQNAFDQLKQSIIKPPVLQMPNFSKPFIVTCDASDFAIGSVLSQLVDSFDLPIAYASRTLNKAEQNYAVIEKELLSIVWSVNYFRPYLYGHKFQIVTDHKPLIWLCNLKNPSSRLMRWKIKLDEFDYTIIHKPGSQNTNADALSRIHSENTYDCYAITRAQTQHINEQAMNKVQPGLDENPMTTPNFYNNELEKLHDSLNNLELLNLNKSSNNDHSDLPSTSNIHLLPNNSSVSSNSLDLKANDSNRLESSTYHHENVENKSFEYPLIPNFDIKYINDESEINQLILDFHISPLGGHQGVFRTYNRIKQYYNFPNMHSTIKNVISSCKQCQTNKHSRFTKEPMRITTTSSRSLQKIFLDIVGPMVSSYNNNKFILTIQDDLSKYSVAIAMPNQEANVVAKSFVDNFICVYGIPDEVLTDQGTNFMSSLFSEVCKLLKIRKLCTTAYHPQSNGSLERFHKTLGEYLRNFSQSDLLNWDLWLPYFTFTYNSTPHSSTGLMPYELVFGMKPNIPISLYKEPEPVYTFDDFYQDLRYRLQTSFTIAKRNISNAKEKSKNYYDRSLNPITFNKGDLVLIKNEARASKLSPLWLGPYVVQDVLSDENSVIRIGRSNKTIHHNRLKHFKTPD